MHMFSTRHTTSFQGRVFPPTVRDSTALRIGRIVEIEYVPVKAGQAEPKSANKSSLSSCSTGAHIGEIVRNFFLPDDCFHCELVVEQHELYCMHMKLETRIPLDDGRAPLAHKYQPVAAAKVQHLYR